MLYGIGTDIVAVARIHRMLERHGERLARRLLHPAEQDEFARSRDAGRFLAKRFAAKEAFAKALGTGLRPPAVLGAIGVTHDAYGKPAYLCSEELAEFLDARGLRAHLSISDEQEYVVAFAVLETLE